MDHIDNPPVIASASNSFSFDFSDPFNSFDFSIPFHTSLPDVLSFNTNNSDGNPDAQECPAGNQPTQISNPPACATGLSTPLPVWGTPATTATIPTSVLEPQTDETRRIVPLPFRNHFSSSLNGLQPQNDQNPGTTPLPLCSTASTSSIVPSALSLSHQTNENMPPPPLPTANGTGKKRKSIPAEETAAPSKPKKARKARPLPEKQKQRRQAPNATSDNQVVSVTPGHNSVHNATANGVDPLPSSFPNQMIPDQHPHQALDGTIRPNDPSATQRPPMGVVDSQHLQHLISIYGLPGVVAVDVTKQYPTRILEMIVSVNDPHSKRTIGAYFVPYVWFPEDPKRPYRVHKDDRCFWGRRIYEYHQRVQCGRIGYTIAGSPVLFFKKEDKQKIDSINYHILVNSHRQKEANIQNQVTQSLPGSVVDQGFDATTLVANPGATSSSHVDVLPTEEQPPFNVQNNDSEDTSTNTTAVVAQQYQQSFFPSTSDVNIFADSQLHNNNNDAGVDANITSDPSYNIYLGSSTDISQSFPEISGLTSNNFHESQFNSYNNSAPNVDTNANFTFNINDLPIIDLPSPDISQPLPELNNLASNTFPEYQINNNSASNVNTDASSVTFNINDLPVIEQTPPNEFIQSFPDSSDSTTNSSFHLLEFGNDDNTAFNNVNPDALTNFAFNNNDLPIIEQAPSTETVQSFPESGYFTANPSFHLSQFGNDTTSNINPYALSNFASNATDLPIIEQAPSTEIIQSVPESGDLTVNPAFHLSQFSNTTSSINPNALTNFGFNPDDLPIIEQAPSTEIIQSFPELGDLTVNPLHLSQFDTNTASSINPDALTNLAFNINDLPIIEEAPSTEMSQTFSEMGSNLDPTLSSLGVQQFDNDINNEFDVDTFLRLHALSNSVESSTIGSSTIDPAPFVDISQSELEDMYTNLNWLCQEAEPSTSS